MGLHQELTADLIVVVDDQVRDLVPVQLFTSRKTRRSGADDGNGGFINIQGYLFCYGNPLRGVI